MENTRLNTNVTVKGETADFVTKVKERYPSVPKAKILAILAQAGLSLFADKPMADFADAILSEK